jgi:cytochrome c oxidase, subunit II|nr:cytochrome c oxidase subunit II [Rothia aeria]
MVLLVTGCSMDRASVGWLPVKPGQPATDNAENLMHLWVGTWAAALVVGLITWGLMLWCIIAYRRRKNETGYPRQLSYHLPLEVFYTFVPVVLIVSMFTFSDRVERQVTAPKSGSDRQVSVEVYGKQWAWDFNYTDANVHVTGVQAHLDGSEGKEAALPTLYLPANSNVDITLKSRDVIHSFWVPAFLEKRDTIPGMTNHIYITTKEPGDYKGKCAELCGEYHSEMLFNVKVVSREDYDKYIESLKQNPENQGVVGDEYNRNPNQNATPRPADK